MPAPPGGATSSPRQTRVAAASPVAPDLHPPANVGDSPAAANDDTDFVVVPPPAAAMPASPRSSSSSAAVRPDPHEFPVDLELTPERARALRERREREAQRVHGRRRRRSQSWYVPLLRISCILAFAVLLLLKLDGDIDGWYGVFVPLWLDNVDKAVNHVLAMREARLEARLDRQRRDDLLLPPVSALLVVLGSFISKFFLVARLEGAPGVGDWSYTLVFTPLWAAVGL